jgi:hypothetical protein
MKVITFFARAVSSAHHFQVFADSLKAKRPY